MRLLGRTLGKHKETGSRSSGHDARAYLRRLLPRPSGLRNRSSSMPNVHVCSPCSSLVYWRELSPGAVEVQRGFIGAFGQTATAFQGVFGSASFLRMSASSAYFARIGMGISSLRALQTFSLHVRLEMLQQHCDLSHVGKLINTQAAQVWRKLRARGPQERTAQAFVGYANYCAARRIALVKRKGRPEGRPSCSGCRNGGQ